jgi:hypothetical protein
MNQGSKLTSDALKIVAATTDLSQKPPTVTCRRPFMFFDADCGSIGSLNRFGESFVHGSGWRIIPE